MEKIYVDNSIYITEPPKGFKPTGYAININHPEIHKLYNNYKVKHKIPLIYPLSDKERIFFENIIFKMIRSGIIVVMEDGKNERNDKSKNEN